MLFYIPGSLQGRMISDVPTLSSRIIHHCLRLTFLGHEVQQVPSPEIGLFLCKTLPIQKKWVHKKAKHCHICEHKGQEQLSLSGTENGLTVATHYILAIFTSNKP